MIRKAGIKFTTLPDEAYDEPLGLSTGAATIFGATGGVMEAALRTAVETLTGEELPSVDFTEVRGIAGIKEATYHVAGMDVKVAVASGLGNARELLNRVKSGEAEYHFIEIMGCPGGCVNGGGQPQQPGPIRNTGRHPGPARKGPLRLGQSQTPSASRMRTRPSRSSTPPTWASPEAPAPTTCCTPPM